MWATAGTYPDLVRAVLHPPAVPSPGPPARRRRAVTSLWAALSVLALLVALVAGAGWWVRHRVEVTVAGQLRSNLSGRQVSVHISSFPFLVHLAGSGTIGMLSAHLGQLSAGPFTYDGVDVPPATFRDVDIRVAGLRLDRQQLLHHRVVIVGVRRATITATLDQADVDRSVGLPLTLADGTVGLGGLALPAAVSVGPEQVTVAAANQFSFSFSPPPLQVFPCRGAVVIRPGKLQLTCTIDHLPPVLAGQAFVF